MEKFGSLSLPKRLAVVAVVLALITWLAFALISSDKSKREAANTPVGINASHTPSASAEPEPSPSPSEYEPAEAVNGFEPEDYANAQTATQDGITNFYSVYSSETPEDRIARLTPYFQEGSDYLTLLPDGGELNPQDEDTKVDMSGEIVVDNPISAQDGTYVTIITLTTGVQFTYGGVGEDSGERPQVLYGDETVTVTTQLVGSSWLITNIEVQR